MRGWLVCIALTSCGLFPSLGDLTNGDAGADAVAGDVAAPDTGVDSGADARSDAPSDVSVAPDGCSGKAGPTLVQAGSVCIDGTEVTNVQYTQFLAAATSTSRPECSWKTTYKPGGTWPYPPGADNYPVAYVDWCDAVSFCEWSGKRLCGRIGGGPIVQSSAGNSALDQWTAACSHAGDGNHLYPYGNTFTPSACNGPEHDSGATLPVGFLTTCAGGYPKMFDMIGNVYEWEDGCSAATGASDDCNQRSGSFTDPPGATTTCAYYRSAARNFRDNDIGFRCCGP